MTIDEIAERERRNGWFLSTAFTAQGWSAQLDCGIDVLEDRLPRPKIDGQASQMAAVTLVIRAREQLMKGRLPRKDQQRDQYIQKKIADNRLNEGQASPL